MTVKKGVLLKVEWDSFVAEGEETAFYKLYAHYHKYFTYLGMKRGAGSNRISDCIHDLFLYVFENREKLGEVRDHHSYLVSSFVRALFKKVRFSAEESEDMEVVASGMLVPAFEGNFMDRDTSEKVGVVLKGYIDALPLSQARIVYEKFYLNLSYEEIAAAHNITVRTAYNTIFKAVERLRKHIGENKLASLAAAITALSILFYFFFG